MRVVDRLIAFASPKVALRRALRLSDQGKPGEAFALFTRLARAGIIEAEYRVARAYLEGAGVPPSRVEGARWLQRAAGRGHLEAQSLLATLCVHGLAEGIKTGQPDRLFADDKPGEPDFASALAWARQAAEAGSAKAQAVLAYVLTCAPEPLRDLAEAHRWYRHSAATGCPEGCLGYALSLAPRTHDEAGRREVAEHLHRAADGVPQAQLSYGRMLADGRGVTADPDGARAWIARAAAAGLTEAQVALAEMMVNGRGGPRDPATAVELFEKAADHGHSGAMFALGALHAGGHDLPEDRTAARRWFRAAAERGHGQAQLMLARYLAAGAGGEPDPAQARSWLEQACAQGIEASQAALAALPSPPPQ